MSKPDVVRNFTLTKEADERLTALAEQYTEGNRSLMLRKLILEKEQKGNSTNDKARNL